MNTLYDESVIDQEALAKANSLSVVEQQEMRMSTLFGSHVTNPINHSSVKASRPNLRVVTQEQKYQDEAMSIDFTVDSFEPVESVESVESVEIDDVEAKSGDVIGGFSFGKTLEEMNNQCNSSKKTPSRRGTGYLGLNGRDIGNRYIKA